jgi:uncharacterized protein YqgC (DUF456 family)
MTLLWAFLLGLALAIGWLLTLLGMPGNWLIVAATALYAYAAPGDSRLAIGWPVVAVLAGLAILGEVVELVAGAMGVAKAGGSRRSAVLALLGSVAGALVGIFIGIPIPVVGSLIAAVLFAGIGALAGAMLGESWKGRSLDQSLTVGKAAFWGRLFGTLAKTLIGTVMAVVALVSLIVR